MPLTKDDLQQIDALLSQRLAAQRADIMLDMRTLLQPIYQEISHIKDRLDRVYKMATEDTSAAFQEIESLKRKIKQLETRIATLEK